jgi:hypothetical protein
MIRAHRWIGTTGGPHLLIAEELLAYWRGIEGWHDHGDPKDQSDYARACRITTWLGAISCHGGTAVVLSGDVGDIAWMPTQCGEGGFLVQWLAVDDESLIEPTLRSKDMPKIFSSSKAETLEFHSGPSGAMRLFDASELGCNLRDDSQVLALKPGKYRMRAGCFDSPRVLIIVREILRV